MMSARFARAGLRATQFSVPRTAAVNGIRSYATPAQETRAPIALFGVDGTYASALVCTSIAPVLSRPLTFTTSRLSPEPLPLKNQSSNPQDATLQTPE
jgi:Tfp pilus assembly PilM family ATPase